MRRYIISDPHFGHKIVINFNNNFRSLSMGGVDTIEEHDQLIVDRVNSLLRPFDILIIAGDLGKNFFKCINEMNCHKMILLGNHDLLPMERYLELEQAIIINDINIDDEHFLSHIPLHTDALSGRKNIHGHVHGRPINNERYINTCIEMTCGWPLPVDLILDGSYTTHNIVTPEDAIKQAYKLELYRK